MNIDAYIKVNHADFYGIIGILNIDYNRIF